MNPFPVHEHLQQSLHPVRTALLGLDPDAQLQVEPLTASLLIKSRLSEGEVRALSQQQGVDLDAVFAQVQIRQRGGDGCCGGCCG